jgi:hypothetical protein
MKYEIDKVGEPGRLYIEEEDLLGVKPSKDGTHAAELTVRYRKQYQSEEAFEWQGAGKDLKLRLVTRQARWKSLRRTAFAASFSRRAVKRGTGTTARSVPR